MSNDFLEIVGSGRLGADPTIKKSKKGELYAELQFAVNKRYFDKSSDEWQIAPTNWYTLLAFQNLDFVKTLKKGDEVTLVGHPTSNKSGQVTFVADLIGKSSIGKEISPLSLTNELEF